MTRVRAGPTGLQRRAALLALAVAALLCFAGALRQSLWTPDEPREAEIGREMLVSGWSAMPTLGGEPFLEKPPLFPWVMAAAYWLFGKSDGVARLPAVLFAVATVMIAYALGRRAAGRAAGLCSAVVLATFQQFADTSHAALNDTALAFFVAAGHLTFLEVRGPTRGSRAWSFAAMGLCAGLAFLTKGPIGPVLLAGPPILAGVALREWTFVRYALPRAALACALGVAAFGLPWVLALAHTPGGGWDAVETCLVTNTVGRALGGGTEEYGFSGHARPPWYYLFAFPVAALPWVLALPAALRGGTLRRGWRAGRVRFLAFVALAGVVLLSVPSGKRGLYTVPLLPAAAVPVGAWLSRAGSRRAGKLDRRSFRVLLGLFALMAVLLAGLLAYAAAFGSLPASREDLGPHGSFAAVAGAAALAAAALAAWRFVPAAAPRAAARVAGAAVVVVFALHAFGRPLLDPYKSMREGVLDLARAVPAEEELLALSADETTIAVVQFYSGRVLRNVETPQEAGARLDTGPARHVVVMEKDVRKLGALRRRLRLAATVRLNATRVVHVYEVTPG